MGRLSLGATVLACALAIAIGGCLPDLSGFQVTDDAGVPPDPDAGGMPGVPVDPPLGSDCGSQYLAVSVVSHDYDGVGRIRRFTLPALEECRETDVASEHLDFGSGVYGITGLPDGTEAVGVEYGVVALDREGFPRWRLEVEATSGFNPGELFPFNVAGIDYVAVLHYDQYGDAAGLLLVDPSDGSLQAEIADAAWDIISLAPDPARPGNVLVGLQYGDIGTFALAPGTSRIEDGEPVLARTMDIGGLATIDADPVSDRVVLAHDDALLVWDRGAATPSAPLRCGAPCDGFHAATYDPTDTGSVLALCNDAERGAVRHLVRVPTSPGGCELVADGTLLGNRAMFELAIVTR